MPDQARVGFVLGAWLLAAVVVILARASVGILTERRATEHQSSATATSAPGARSETVDTSTGGLKDRPEQDRIQSLEALSTDILLVNVLVTQGGVIVLILGGALLADLPMRALGVAPSLVHAQPIAIGVAVGLGLYSVDELLSMVARRLGYVPEELLRSALTPTSVMGWVILVSAILPLVAVGEELLFRAALLGATPLVGTVPTVAMLLLSSLLFGLAHAVQGRAGVIVAAVLGLGLGSTYLITGNLVVVVVAHYLVNVFEFLIHELLGLEID